MENVTNVVKRRQSHFSERNKMNPQMTQANLLKTRSIDDNHYADLWLINNELITFLMTKTAEPNVFSVLKQENGDLFDTISLDA